jgi:hypothetical protein
MTVVHFGSARGRAILDAIQLTPLRAAVGDYPPAPAQLLHTFAAELGAPAQDLLNAARDDRDALTAEAERIALAVRSRADGQVAYSGDPEAQRIALKARGRADGMVEYDGDPEAQRIALKARGSAPVSDSPRSSITLSDAEIATAAEAACRAHLADGSRPLDDLVKDALTCARREKRARLRAGRRD